MADRDKGRPKGYSSKKKGNSDSEDEYNDPDLLNLPETERERIIMERYERREREKRKQAVLEREAKGSMNKPTTGAQKSELLSQLHNKRLIAKDRKERIAAENRDESDEGSYSESDGEISNKKNRRRGKDDDDEDFVVDEEDKKAMRMKAEKKRKTSPERKSPEKATTVTMESLEKIRVSRKNLALLLSHSIFEKTIKGAFVRVNQSSGTKTAVHASAHDYAIAQVVAVQTYHKSYKVDDKETNKILILKHGSKERPMKMCFISNGEFTGAEFTKWINRMQRENQRIPSAEEIELKSREIQKGLKYKYTDEEIRKNIDQRVSEKLRRGEALTSHEIEVLENKKIQKQREYWEKGGSNDPNNEDMKKEIDQLEQDIVKAKKLLNKNPRPVRKEEDKKVAMEMEEMFKEEEEEEEDAGKSKIKKEDDGKMEIEEEDEEEKASRERMLEEMKKKGWTMSEMYNQMKKDFINNHKVDLAIDSIIDEWNIETEVA